VFTSYDYGAAISEAREVRDKALEMKQLGGLIASVPDLAGMVPAGPVEISTDTIQVYHNRSPETDARFLLVTQKPSNDSGDHRFTITANLPDGRYTLPMRLNGYDAKWLVAGVDLAGQRLVYSTSELQTSMTLDGEALMLLYGRAGETGQTALRYASAPTVRVIEGDVTHRFDAARGDLVLDYPHQGLARVRIEGGGRPPLTLLLADEPEAMRFWKDGDVLVRGPQLLRTAAIKGSTLALSGDTTIESPLEIWGPRTVRSVTWNGARVATAPGVGISRIAARPLAGPASFALPTLDRWRTRQGSPEAQPGFDDGKWQAIDRRAYASTTARPDGQPNMSMDAYGFHEGDVWYRGRFTGTADAKRLALNYGAGGSGMVQVWIDGEFVGQHELSGGLPRPITTASASFDLPASARTPGEHVIAVMVRNNGHNWDLDADDYHKEARGLISASVEAPGGRNFSIPTEWKIQGRRGGEDLADPVRGITNNGGLFGEREGWHLPGYDDRRWDAATLPASTVQPGTTWYRTAFDLAVPKGQDATIALAFGDTTTPRSPNRYRALIFVNGWNMGQFIAHVGPQRLFPIPEGILNHRGANTIALAVTSDGAPGNALEPVKLVTMRNVRGGVPVRMVKAPQTPAELK
jgi:hypothetical protein